MSYFEPSRRPFERRRIGSWASLVDFLCRQPAWQRPLFALLLAAYIAAASSLCGASLAASLVTGLLLTLLLAGLVWTERAAPPPLARLAHLLAAAVGYLVLLLPAIVFVAIGFWLLVSLPLWLYRS